MKLRGRKRWLTRSIATGAVVVVLAVLGGSMPAYSYPRPYTVERVSVRHDGSQAEKPSGGWWRFLHPEEPTNLSTISRGTATLSADGRYVAFASADPKIIPDTPDFLQTAVYVRDRTTGTNELVSVAHDDGLIQDLVRKAKSRLFSRDAFNPSISADGRYVAYMSTAEFHAPDDENGDIDLFVYDRDEKKTYFVSKISNRSGERFYRFAPPVISGNGRYVAIWEWNLEDEECTPVLPPPVPDIPELQTCSHSNGVVSRYEVKTGHRETVTPTGDDVNGSPYLFFPSISHSGRYIAYSYYAGDLAATASPHHIFVRDMRKEEPQLVSRSIDGDPADGASALSSHEHTTSALSRSGRFVTFFSRATDLVPNDGRPCKRIGSLQTCWDTYVHDRRTGRTERVSVTSEGEAIDALSGFEGGSISGNGRFVTFTEWDHGYPGSLTTERDATRVITLRVYDRSSGTMQRLLSVSDDPILADEGIVPINDLPEPLKQFNDIYGFEYSFMWPQMSHSGRHIAFVTFGDEAVPNDTNGIWDAFVIDRGPLVGADTAKSRQHEDPEPEICIVEDVCLTTHGGVTSPAAGTSTIRGASLLDASLVYRTGENDVFTTIEISDMPAIDPTSPLLYGVRFEADGVDYEVRASSLLHGTFGLFECHTLPCRKVADLRGGFGTTGQRIVFSLPLDVIGLDEGDRLKDVEAFSALGSYLSGTTKILDRIPIAQ